MILIHGTKRTERPQGLVADLCPICHDIRPFQLMRVGRASHVYYVSFGEGELIGYAIRCEACGVMLGTRLETYSTPWRSDSPDLESLIQMTFPALRQVHAERLALAERVRRSPASLTTAQRQQVLREPFLLLNPLVEARYAAQMRFDRPSGLACLTTAVLSGTLLGVGLWWMLEHEGYALIIAGASVLGLGTVYTGIQLLRAPARFVRQKILPHLAQAVAPLEPSQSEIKECLADCASQGRKIGRKVKPVDVQLALHEQRQMDSRQRVAA